MDSLNSSYIEGTLVEFNSVSIIEEADKKVFILFLRLIHSILHQICSASLTRKIKPLVQLISQNVFSVTVTIVIISVCYVLQITSISILNFDYQSCHLLYAFLQNVVFSFGRFQSFMAQNVHHNSARVLTISTAMFIFGAKLRRVYFCMNTIV